MELEIVSGGIAEKEERKNHKERGCHHNEQRQGNEGSTGDGGFLPRRESALRRRRVRQGIASGSLDVAAQRLWLKLRKWAIRDQRSVENVPVISREINLAATLQKPLPARPRSFEVE